MAVDEVAKNVSFEQFAEPAATVDQPAGHAVTLKISGPMRVFVDRESVACAGGQTANPGTVMISFVITPAEIAAGLRDVDFLRGVLSDIGDEHATGGRVEG